MNKIFSDLRDQVSNIIRFSKDDDLQRINFPIDVIKQLNTEFPEFDVENAKFEIRKKVIDYKNNPTTFYSTPDKIYESYFVTIPIKYNYYFEPVFSNITETGFRQMNNKFLIYEEISEDDIEGNNENILRLRERFRDKYNTLDTSFKSKKDYFQNYIDKDLNEHIIQQIKDEVQRRRINKESKDLLNPFK